MIAVESFLVSLPDDVFERGFGTEWFIRDSTGTDLFAPIESVSDGTVGV